MTSSRRAAIARLLLLVLPFHALLAVGLDLRGPAHFHVHDDEDDHAHRHAHEHGLIEHHHHAAADRSVVPVEDGALDSRDATEEIASGWSSTMCAALPSAAEPWHVAGAATGVAAGPADRPKTRFPGRLERPPRLLHA
jgi:hypothetical protein